MTKETSRFHLAWHRIDIRRASEGLFYILVPEWLGIIDGSVDLQRVDHLGKPVGRINSTPRNLASPRRQEDTEGFPHPIERRLIEALRERARRADVILPEIVPTLKSRAWSQMSLSEAEREMLLRAGGAL
jgi:hypothetical protein